MMVENNDGEKLELGVGYIGASNVANVCGVGYKSMIETYLEIIGDRKSEPNERMEAGIKYESHILTLFEKEKGCKLEQHQAEFVYPISDKNGWKFMRVHVDSIWEEEEEGIPVEAKLIDKAQIKSGLWGEPGTDQVPIYYALQVHDQMLLTGAGTGYLIALFVDHKILKKDDNIEKAAQEYRIYRFKKDFDLSQEILNRQISFWNQHIVPKKPPPLQKERSDILEQIRMLYPKIIENSVVEMTVLNSRRIFELHENIGADNLEIKMARRMLHDAETSRKQHLGKIELIMGNFEKTPFIHELDGFYKRSRISRRGYSVKPTEYLQVKFEKEKIT